LETERPPSLLDIQSSYFELLDIFFATPFAQMKKHQLNPHQIAKQAASVPSLLKAFEAEGAEFASSIREFWSVFGVEVDEHVRRLPGLKSFFGGDVFPSYARNIANSVGLYVDTILLPDPLLKLCDFIGKVNPETVLYLVMKHALNAMQYREIILAPVDQPIAVIVPNHSLTEPAYLASLQVSAESDVLKHTSKLFGVDFRSAEDSDRFLQRLATPEAVAAAIADPNRFLIDTEWKGQNIADQIRKYENESLDRLGFKHSEVPAGIVVLHSLLGRMMQAGDAVLGSSQTSAVPLMDAPTSWQYLLWKYEYDGKDQGADNRDLLVTTAIGAEGDEALGLISNVPTEALIELRKNGAVAGLRETFGKGIGEINNASEANLAEVSNLVRINLYDAFRDHQREVASLSSSHRKFFGVDVSSWIASGGISFAAAATGSVALGLLAAAYTMLGPPSLRELKAKWTELQRGSDALRRSPTGILFRHLD